MREESDLFGDGATEVVERLADIRWVIVGLIGVLRAKCFVSIAVFL